MEKYIWIYFLQIAQIANSFFNCFLYVFHQYHIWCLSSCVMPFYYFFIFLLYVFLNCTNYMCVFNQIEKNE